MPTIKGYSVSRTAAGGTGVTSTVYSYSGAAGGRGHCGRNGAYDYPTDQGLTEARIPTLLRGDKAAIDHDVTDLGNPTVEGPARTTLASTLVTATTTTISGGGAGLIVQFTVDANGALPDFADGAAVNAVPTGDNFRIINGGEGYDTNDVVEIDGWPGSRVAVTAED